jgi:copper chaperone
MASEIPTGGMPDTSKGTLVSQTVLSVPDISCDHCARTVTNALTPLAGVERVAVDIPAKRVTVDYDAARVGVAQMSAALAEEDYPVAADE